MAAEKDERVTEQTPVQSIQQDGRDFAYSRDYQGVLRKNRGFPPVYGTSADEAKANLVRTVRDHHRAQEEANRRLQEAIEGSCNAQPSKGKMSAAKVDRAALKQKLQKLNDQSNTMFAEWLLEKSRETYSANFRTCGDPQKVQPLLDYYKNDKKNNIVRKRAMRNICLANQELLIIGAQDPLLLSAVLKYQESNYDLTKSAAMVADKSDYKVIAWDPTNNHVKLEMTAPCNGLPVPLVDQNYVCRNKEKDVTDAAQVQKEKSTPGTQAFLDNMYFVTHYDIMRKLVNFLLARPTGYVQHVAPKLQGEAVLWRGVTNDLDPVLKMNTGDVGSTSILISSTIDMDVARDFAWTAEARWDRTTDRRMLTFLAIHLKEGMEVPVIVPGCLKEGFYNEAEVVLPPGLMIKRVGDTVMSLPAHANLGQVNVIYCTVEMESQG